MSTIEPVADEVTLVLTFINHTTGGSHSAVLDVDGFEETPEGSISHGILIGYGADVQVGSESAVRARVNLIIEEEN